VLDEMVGNKFGLLTVVSRGKDYVTSAGYLQKRWSCLCDCGAEHTTSKYLLTSGKVTSCGHEKRLPEGEASFNGLYRSYMKSAKDRGYSFSLSKERFREETKKDCFYCGDPPSTVWKNNPGCNGVYTYNGIDRIDNSIGYQDGNIVSCCVTCNRAKSTSTLEYFEEKILKMYKKLIERRQF
jgi:hypothetical protein